MPPKAKKTLVTKVPCSRFSSKSKVASRSRSASVGRTPSIGSHDSGPKKRSRPPVSKPRAGYTLYSSDSEERIGEVDKGLNRCASIVKQMLEVRKGVGKAPKGDIKTTAPSGKPRQVVTREIINSVTIPMHSPKQLNRVPVVIPTADMDDTNAQKRGVYVQQPRQMMQQPQQTRFNNRLATSTPDPDKMDSGASGTLNGYFQKTASPGGSGLSAQNIPVIKPTTTNQGGLLQRILDHDPRQDRQVFTGALQGVGLQPLLLKENLNSVDERSVSTSGSATQQSPSSISPGLIRNNIHAQQQGLAMHGQTHVNQDVTGGPVCLNQVSPVPQSYPRVSDIHPGMENILDESEYQQLPSPQSVFQSYKGTSRRKPDIPGQLRQSEAFFPVVTEDQVEFQMEINSTSRKTSNSSVPQRELHADQASGEFHQPTPKSVSRKSTDVSQDGPHVLRFSKFGSSKVLPSCSAAAVVVPGFSLAGAQPVSSRQQVASNTEYGKNRYFQPNTFLMENQDLNFAAGVGSEKPVRDSSYQSAGFSDGSSSKVTPLSAQFAENPSPVMSRNAAINATLENQTYILPRDGSENGNQSAGYPVHNAQRYDSVSAPKNSGNKHYLPAMAHSAMNTNVAKSSMNSKVAQSFTNANVAQNSMNTNEAHTFMNTNETQASMNTNVGQNFLNRNVAQNSASANVASNQICMYSGSGAAAAPTCNMPVYLDSHDLAHGVRDNQSHFQVKPAVSHGSGPPGNIPGNQAFDNGAHRDIHGNQVFDNDAHGDIHRNQVFENGAQGNIPGNQAFDNGLLPRHPAFENDKATCSETYKPQGRLPLAGVDVNIRTEINRALQPLITENSQLRSELRSVNQQLKDFERQFASQMLKEKEKESVNQQSKESAVLSAPDQETHLEVLEWTQSKLKTLEQLLHEEQCRSDDLETELRQCQRDLDQYKTDRQKLLVAIAEKDAEKLRVRQESQQEVSHLHAEVQLHQKQCETYRLKLDASEKESHILAISLKQRDTEIDRLQELVQTMKKSMSELIQDQSRRRASGQLSGSFNLQRLERLLREGNLTGFDIEVLNQHDQGSAPQVYPDEHTRLETEFTQLTVNALAKHNERSSLNLRDRSSQEMEILNRDAPRQNPQCAEDPEATNALSDSATSTIHDLSPVSTVKELDEFGARVDGEASAPPQKKVHFDVHMSGNNSSLTEVTDDSSTVVSEVPSRYSVTDYFKKYPAGATGICSRPQRNNHLGQNSSRHVVVKPEMSATLESASKGHDSEIAKKPNQNKEECLQASSKASDFRRTVPPLRDPFGPSDEDVMSLTSGITFSSVSTLATVDESVFREGLANLDANIARLQESLSQKKALLST